MLRPTIRVTLVLTIMIGFSALFIFLTSGILEPRLPGPEPLPPTAREGSAPVVRPVPSMVAPAGRGPATPRPRTARADTRGDTAARTATDTTGAKSKTAAPRFGRLLGLVRDPEGRPVAGVDVLLDRDGRELPVESDVDGRFRFPDLPAGPYRIRAFHPDYAPWVEKARGRRIVVVGGRESTVEIGLTRGLRIEGVVVAADGTGPVGGAVVTLAREEYARRLFVETTADGRFRFDHFPKHPKGERPFPLEVVKEGFSPGYDKVAATTAGPRIEIELDRGTLVHGRVIDEFNQPLDGVEISCKFRYRFIKKKSALTARTDNLGRYRVPNVPKNFVIQVWAEKKGYRRTYLNLIAGPQQHQKLMPPLRLHRKRR